MNKTTLELYIYMGNHKEIILWLESEKVVTKKEALLKIQSLVESNLRDVGMSIGQGNYGVSLRGTSNCVDKIVQHFEKVEKEFVEIPKIEIIQKLESVSSEDGGCFEYETFEVEPCKENGMYIKVCSWDETKEHKEFNKFKGKKLKITIEIVEEPVGPLKIEKEVEKVVERPTKFDSIDDEINDYVNHFYD